MSKGILHPPEWSQSADVATGAMVRQVTSHPSIHHQPFFFIPAFDDAMQWLFFISHRTGTPQVFACDLASGRLLQLTDHENLNEWSIHPAIDGTGVYYTAGTTGWRIDVRTLCVERLIDLNASAIGAPGMVAAAMGTTTLSRDGHWWAISYKRGVESELVVVDTRTGSSDVILRRDSIAHVQFCPDDPSILFYAGPLTDRVWLINRDGTGNRRLYKRNVSEKQWITHETWLPNGRRELAFVDWPHGMQAIHIDTGAVRRLTSFNAWHAASNRSATLMVSDTNFPDIGLQLFDPSDGVGRPRTLCHPNASSLGQHWAGPFPYDAGPINVYAPQHTHPHPQFSPDGRSVVFTSDRTGSSQVYIAEINEAFLA